MQTIRKLFTHMDWANRRMLEALQAAPSEESRSAAILFLHVLQAERIWLTRLRGESSQGLSVWSEDADLSVCAAWIEENGRGFQDWLDALPEEQLDEQIAYRNLSGAPYEASARDILTHIALHGQYHRGQINTALRNGGNKPAPLDYILYAQLNRI